MICRRSAVRQILGASSAAVPVGLVSLAPQAGAKSLLSEDNLGSIGSVANVQELARATPPGDGGVACLMLVSGDRSGIFVWRIGDFLQAALRDPLGGITVASRSVSASQGAWSRVYEGAVLPEWFGALGDGEASDSAALQAAFDLGDSVHLKPGAIYLAENLVLPDRKNWQLVMNGAVIRAGPAKSSKFVMASYNYVNRVTTTQNPAVILGPGVIDGAGRAESALIIQSWSSTIGGGVALEVRGALTHGVVLTAHVEGSDELIKSTMVNNDLHLNSHRNGGAGLLIKDKSRNKITDGVLRGRFHSNGSWGVQIQSAAGWDISVQTYGNDGGVWLDGVGKGFRLHNSYIDDGGANATQKLPREAVQVRTVIGRSLVTLADCFFAKGMVRYAGSSDDQGHGIHSRGNVFQGESCLAISGKSGVIVSNGDTFDSRIPCRWIGRTDGRLLVTSSYFSNAASTLSGKFISEDNLLEAIAGAARG